jgi:hypothetical protein
LAGIQGFEEFYAATVGRLLGQLFPVTGDLHEAEEVVQGGVRPGLDPSAGTPGRCPGR